MTVVAVVMAWPSVRAQAPKRHDWRILIHDGCRYAVPVSWHVDPEGSLATAPDGSNVSIRMFHITDWSAHKARIKAAFGRISAMHEDSDHRLWFEIGDKPRVQHYVDVVSNLSVCSALIEPRSSGTDAESTTKSIAESVGPAPDKSPNTFN